MFTCFSHKMTVSVTRPQSSLGFFVLSKTGVSSTSLSYVITMTTHSTKILLRVHLTLVCLSYQRFQVCCTKREIRPPSKTFSDLCYRAVCSQRSLSRLHLFLSKLPVVRTLRGFEAGGDTLLRLCGQKGLHFTKDTSSQDTANSALGMALGDFLPLFETFAKMKAQKGRGFLSGDSVRGCYWTEKKIPQLQAVLTQSSGTNASLFLVAKRILMGSWTLVNLLPASAIATPECFIRVSIAVMEHRDQEKLEEERVYFILQWHITVCH